MRRYLGQGHGVTLDSMICYTIDMEARDDIDRCFCSLGHHFLLRIEAVEGISHYAEQWETAIFPLFGKK